MLIDVDYQVPEKCDDCKFRIKGTGDFGRTRVFICLFTGIGDSYAKGSMDISIAEKRMRKSCPFLK